MWNDSLNLAPLSLELAVAEIKAIHPDDGQALDRLMDYLGRTRPMLTEIRAAVCEFYCILPNELAAYNREIEIARVRHVFFYLAHRHTRFSNAVIGQFVGNRDPSTVFHGVRTIEKLLATKPLVADDIDLLRLRISEKVLLRCAAGRA